MDQRLTEVLVFKFSIWNQEIDRLLHEGLGTSLL